MIGSTYPKVSNKRAGWNKRCFIHKKSFPFAARFNSEGDIHSLTILNESDRSEIGTARISKMSGQSDSGALGAPNEN